ncbi:MULTISPECIES: chromate transporter [Aneurinibacillus]|jgi:chromate transporter|uniref:Putative transporter YwrB n=1 Tax=Aneurinibacillus danicus TaxID=267746 RepID=A0A511V3D4_9BACL|nr:MULTISPECIES: chromate transporter [Aneurinibacillus]GEN33420.1 putative transporter YwrB [Aneurinibacillus danicus]
MSYGQLFNGFFRAGILGYGGGPSMLPLIHAEAVKKYRWIDDEEFSDIVALANALPGPIATKMAAYIGYKQKGFLGAFVTIFAVSIPVLVLMIGLLGFLFQFRHSPIVKGMVAGIQPVIGVMMAVLAYEFFSKAWKQVEKRGKTFVILLTVASSILLTVLSVSPAILIAVVLAGAFLFSTRKQRAERKVRSEASYETDQTSTERSG